MGMFVICIDYDGYDCFVVDCEGMGFVIVDWWKVIFSCFVYVFLEVIGVGYVCDCFVFVCDVDK